MKRVIKNILLTFMIIFTVLNILGFIFNSIYMKHQLYEEVVPLLDGEIDAEETESDISKHNSYKERYGENAPSTLLSWYEGYFLAKGNILDFQLSILMISVFFGVAIGVIVSLSERNKAKQIVLFIAIGLGLALLATIYSHLTTSILNSFFDDFFRTFIEDYILNYWMYYIAIYLIIYIIRYFIASNKAKKLNAELKK